MELWIRSQDKTTLINAQRIDVNYNNIIVWDEGRYASKIYLGIYKTKERALEVLDEIHKCIIDKEVLDGCNNILTLANNKSQNEVKEILARAEKIAVYEMPEK